MNFISDFLKKIKNKSEADKHNFSVLVASILTFILAIFILMSWYLQFFDLPIEETLLTKIVSWFN